MWSRTGFWMKLNSHCFFLMMNNTCNCFIIEVYVGNFSTCCQQAFFIYTKAMIFFKKHSATPENQDNRTDERNGSEMSDRELFDRVFEGFPRQISRFEPTIRKVGENLHKSYIFYVQTLSNTGKRSVWLYAP